MYARKLCLLLLSACCAVLCAPVHAATQQQAVLERDAQLLAAPQNGAAVVADVKAGTSGEVVARKGAWVNLKTDAGTGWVFSFNVRFVAPGAAASAPVTAPARRAGVTATIGIRGLDEEDLKNAHFDEAQVRLLDSYAATKQDAESAARATGLTPARVDYMK